jgi:hypothetical protein
VFSLSVLMIPELNSQTKFPAGWIFGSVSLLIRICFRFYSDSLLSLGLLWTLSAVWQWVLLLAFRRNRFYQTKFPAGWIFGSVSLLLRICFRFYSDSLLSLGLLWALSAVWQWVLLLAFRRNRFYH